MGRGRDRRRRQAERLARGRPPEPPPIRVPPTPPRAVRHVLPVELRKALPAWREAYAAAAAGAAAGGEAAVEAAARGGVGAAVGAAGRAPGDLLVALGSATNLTGLGLSEDTMFTWHALKAFWRKPPCTPPPCPDCGEPTVVYGLIRMLFNGTVAWACLTCGIGCQTGIRPIDLDDYVTRTVGTRSGSMVTVAARSSGTSAVWTEAWRSEL